MLLSVAVELSHDWLMFGWQGDFFCFEIIMKVFQGNVARKQLLFKNRHVLLSISKAFRPKS